MEPEIPARIKTLIDRAEKQGWTTDARWVESIEHSILEGWSLRVLFVKRDKRAYGIWFRTINAKGKPSITWQWGGEISHSMHIKTVAALDAYLFGLSDDERSQLA